MIEVAALARRQERLDELARKLEGRKGKLVPIKTDVSKEEDILNAFRWIDEHLGPVHILINSAGTLHEGYLSDGDDKWWNQILLVNVLGLSIATREAIKSMRAYGVDGHIIHINSIGGHRIPNVQGLNFYPASKHAVTALAETLRRELNFLNLRIKVTVCNSKRYTYFSRRF
ncbi:hypothetical protein NQ314_015275 [Rhamnusium bicolor]|uniref:Farnesol dehydrogenase-like n=1 Tax=Rhamnusium bicolor TaxID=1586634 RepID=A0AAV8WZ81_9CUCU|nr:hypothetical protein NQ314_015275 [Rhamnusium bicolor]